MKKNLIIGLILIIFCILSAFFLIKEIPKYRFGYFVKGPTMAYNHSAKPIKLDNGDILFLGQYNKCSSFSDKSTYIPSEIYDYKNNKFQILDTPKNIRYTSEGFLLKNNKLFLTQVYDPNNIITYPHTEPLLDCRLFNQMAILDLKTMNIEKLIPKKINKVDKTYINSVLFALLNNNKILMIKAEDKKFIEIYDISKNSSKLLKNIRTNISSESEIISYDKNKALIFNTDGSVEEYDDAKEEINCIGKIIKRKNFVLQIINEHEIMILGGKKTEGAKSIPEIEIYDTNTNTSRIVGKLLDNRTALSGGKNYFGVDLLNNDSVLIVGGSYPFYQIIGNNKLKSAEVINFKKQKQFKIINMPYRMPHSKIIKLDNNNHLITSISKKTVVFKSRIRGKNESN